MPQYRTGTASIGRCARAQTSGFAPEGVFEAVVGVVGVAAWQNPVGSCAWPGALDDKQGAGGGDNDGADTLDHDGSLAWGSVFPAPADSWLAA
jgi:hypothetical protein